MIAYVQQSIILIVCCGLGLAINWPVASIARVEESWDLFGYYR